MTDPLNPPKDLLQGPVVRVDGAENEYLCSTSDQSPETTVRTSSKQDNDVSCSPRMVSQCSGESSVIATPPASPIPLVSPTHAMGSLSSSDLMEELKRFIRSEIDGHLNRGESNAGPSHDTTAGSQYTGSAVSSSKDPGMQPTVSELDEQIRAQYSAPPRPSVHWRTRAHQMGHQQNTMVGSTEGEKSAPDSKWGVLFDNDGKTTERLGVVLRGVAKHIIDKIAANSYFVIPVSALATFYAEHKLEKEVYPYQDLFSCQNKYKPIEYLFRDLECQYFLIPENGRLRPTVPALTPTGFVQWITWNIYAHPNEESRRMDLIMSRLQIEVGIPGVEGQVEQLPRRMSRHQFPKEHDKRARSLVAEGISEVLSTRALQPLEQQKNDSAPTPSLPSKIRPVPLDNHDPNSNHASRMLPPHSTPTPRPAVPLHNPKDKLSLQALSHSLPSKYGRTSEQSARLPLDGEPMIDCEYQYSPTQANFHGEGSTMERPTAEPDIDERGNYGFPPLPVGGGAARSNRGSNLIRSYTLPTTSSASGLVATPRTLTTIANAGSRRHTDEGLFPFGPDSPPEPGRPSRIQREIQTDRPPSSTMNSSRRHSASKRRSVVVLGPDPGPTYNQVARTSLKSDIVAPFLGKEYKFPW